MSSKRDRAPDHLPEDEELGTDECSLSNRLLDDLRALVNGYSGSGLSHTEVIGCVYVILSECFDAMRDDGEDDDSDGWKRRARS